MLVAIPPVIPGDDIRLSASTYVAWKKCPDNANARLQGIYGPDTRRSFTGSLAHRIFSRHLDRGPIDPGEFEQVCREEIGSSTLNNKMVGLSIKPSELAGVIEEVRGLYERFTRFPGEGFEGSEESLDHEAGNGVRLVGKIDAVFLDDGGGHRLVDWKTGDLGDAEDQLFFYALLWAIERDEMPASVEAISVKTGDIYKTRPTGTDVEKVAEEVSRLVNDVRRAWADGTGLERRGGPWCRYCPILDGCEEGQATEALLG